MIARYNAVSHCREGLEALGFEGEHRSWKAGIRGRNENSASSLEKFD
jgi:hypothetical protein